MLRNAIVLRNSIGQCRLSHHSRAGGNHGAGVIHCSNRVPSKYALITTLLLVAAWDLPANADDVRAEPRANDTASLFERVKPSVVVISFDDRDGDRFGLSSGFVVDAAGLIATNLHVLGEARPISVRTAEGDEYPVVSVHATDRTHDLAVLKIDAKGLKPLKLGDSDALKPGQSVIAVGNPQGLEYSVVEGVVSAVREDVEGQPMLQLAIPIERGNSGGPVIDRDGHVQGIVTLKSRVTDNLGYAVAINALKPLLKKPNPVPMSRWVTIGTLNDRLWKAPDDVRWRQRAGRILVEGRGRGFGGRSLIFSKQELPNLPYEVAVTVKIDEDDGAAGLIFRADGRDRHYGFYPSSGELRLSRFDGPDVYSWNVLAEKSSAAYRPGEWNRLKVRIEPDLIQCYCNDALIFESRDSQYDSGQVGLAKFRHTTAAFKGFEVGEEVRSLVPSAEAKAAIDELLARIPAERPAPPALVDDLLAKAEPQAAGGVLREEARLLEERAVRMRQLADDVHTESVTRELQKLFDGTQEAPDLIHTALLIAALDNDELDIKAYQQQIDQMVEDVKTTLADDADNAAKREALHRYLFEEQGYHGSRTNYDSASNSYLNEVIDDREGLPITLSVLYLSLAERIELPAHGIGLPGHFVVQVQTNDDDWQLVDVFDRGTLMTKDDAATRTASVTGLEWHDEYLHPQSTRDIATRMLRNLINLANNSEDAEDALRYTNALLILEPDSAVDRLFRAVLCYNTQRTERGLADVDWLLEHEPDGVPLIRVRQLRQLIQEQQSGE